MDREHKVGVILILIGICIPLAVLPFVSGYSKEKGIIQNLYSVGIPFRSEKPADTVRPESPAVAEKKPSGKLDLSGLVPRTIPFRFFLAIGIVFLFIGVVRLDRARKRGAKEGGGE